MLKKGLLAFLLSVFAVSAFAASTVSVTIKNDTGYTLMRGIVMGAGMRCTNCKVIKPGETMTLYSMPGTGPKFQSDYTVLDSSGVSFSSFTLYASNQSSDGVIHFNAMEGSGDCRVYFQNGTGAAPNANDDIPYGGSDSFVVDSSCSASSSK